MKFGNLFKPGRIGGLHLKNRIVMAPMSSMLCGEQGDVTDTLINWYARRAKGGAGLILVEVTQVATAVDPFKILLRVLRADDDSYISGFRALTKTIHENGAKIGIQLTPGGGAQVSAIPWVTEAEGKIQPVSPSGIPALGSLIRPRVLAVEEIGRIIELCGDAARNIKQAGFDMIQIHGHGGYLIAQFLSPYFNKRTDKYGGSLEGRCQFLFEIVNAMRKAVGSDFPLTVRFSQDEYIPGGRDIKESKLIARKLEEVGVDGIDISSGVYGARIPAVPPYFFPPGVLLPLSEAMKEVVNIPVMAVGRLNDPYLADRVLKEVKADFISLGRALIADPDWPLKVASGKLEEIRSCLACNECRQQVIKQFPIRCTVNAVAGREGEYEAIKPAEIKKKVLIVGGGPAGMETARVTALRGHQVILCEKRKQLGGLMLLAGVHNQEITPFVRWIVAQIKRLPVEVRLRTEVTPALVEEIQPDVVVLSTGGTFITPEVPGINRNSVFSAKDLLNLIEGIPINKGILLHLVSLLARHFITPSTVRRFLGSNFPIKKRIIIIGGQFAGCSLALSLAQKGKKVTIIEESAQFGIDMENHALTALNFEVEDGNVKILTSKKITEITEKGVTFIDEKGNKTCCEAGTVFLALGLGPADSTLAEELKGKVKEVYTIGDAKSFRRIMEAISEGYTTAYHL